MERPRCPGQDTRFWKPEDIFCTRCPGCGAEIEFWKDEPVLICRGCRQEIRNPRIDLGCAKWCKFAQECLGGLMDNSSITVPVKERLVAAMTRLFGADQRRIDHALKVLGYAETIQQTEGGSALVVRAAAILHDIGIPEAERKYGSADGKHQEIEGPPVARRIMDEAGLPPDVVEHVCRIIASHHTGDYDSREFNILWDADWLVNFPEVFPELAGPALAARVQTLFRTRG